MRYVVTGGLGFIGSHLVRRLVSLGHEVLVVDSREGHGAAGQGVEHVKADVTDRDTMRGAVHGADGVFHLAALVSVPESVARPVEYERINVGGTRSVLGSADRAGAPVVLASSAAVYGGASGRECVPVAEDAACEPTNPYGVTKLECERLLSSGTESGLPSPPAAVSLRLFNVYGPAPAGSAGAGVVARFAARLSARLPPVVHGGGRQVRDFVHVGDVARAFADAMRLASSPCDAGPDRKARRHLVFNIGTGRGTTVLDLARLMARAAGMDEASIGPEFGDAVPGDAAYSVSDPRRAASALGWRPAVALDDGVRSLMAAPDLSS